MKKDTQDATEEPREDTVASTGKVKNTRTIADTLAALESVTLYARDDDGQDVRTGEFELPKKLGTLAKLNQQLEVDYAWWTKRTKGLIESLKEAQDVMTRMKAVLDAIGELE